MRIKGVLVLLNSICAIALMLMYPVFGKSDQQVARLTLMALQESGSLDTNVLARYATSGAWRLSEPPMDCMARRSYIAWQIGLMFVFPSGVVMIVNALLIDLFWKKQGAGPLIGASSQETK